MTPSQKRGAVQATAGMLLVGTLVAVSARIGDYPVYGGQALRYAVGAAALLAVLAIRRPPPVRPTPRQWALLAVLSSTGLVVFNVCIVVGNSYASPATIGTIVGSGPIVMAVLGPLVARSGRPAARVLVAAGIVTAGTAIATGLGGASLPGVLLALGALAGEVSFSLLAVPLLPTLGALRVSAYSAAIAVPMLLGIGLAVDGTGVLRVPTRDELIAFVYLGVVVTAGAFLLWYDALPRLGADRAGLFAGVMPVGAVLTMVVLGVGTPSVPELAGAGLVVAGIVYGVGITASRSGRGGRSRTGTPRSTARNLVRS
ncbi:DMT family transporter [Phytomonospora endophytica]|uniref:Drug/metabolite transporter (DMT)-like permease n=1 Tax=Phytomonospora endophytica TaxID=714109 RepID=A0A841FMI5_9ACTN|nr:DMT family transporter [Phytomonospora endophytica]MBB6037064.1 drug/metabolite transporter (DMT)-like permease [Phytomonospora endophytica]GIG69393.1 membrane protein [Phytomonospora endophytica]